MPVRIILCLVFMLLACKKTESKTPKHQLIKQGDVKIKLSPSAQSLRTCDLLELSIEVSYPANFKIKLPDSKTDFGDFELYQINQNSPESINEKRNRIYQIIILEPGLPATHQLPPLNFTYWDEDNKENNIKSKPLIFTVLSSIDPKKNSEIEDIITQTKETNHTVSIVGSGALFLTLFYFIFLCKPEQISVESPHEVSLKKFQDLKNQAPERIVKQLPLLSANYLKHKFELQSHSQNLDVIISELGTKNNLQAYAEKLKTLHAEYNQLRYGASAYSKDQILSLHKSFDSLFTEIKQ